MNDFPKELPSAGGTAVSALWLELIYRMSVPQDAQATDVSHLAPPGFRSVGIRSISKEEPDVIWLGCGFYAPGGWLISCNAFSRDAQEAETALEYARTLRRDGL